MNEKLIVKIDDLDMNGLGIAHKGNRTIFIDNALPQELIECDIIKQKNSLLFAKNTKIIEKSDLRTTPLCPYFNLCGGCDIQHLNYEKALEFKKQQLLLTFKKVANIDIKNLNIIASDKNYFYRNKISMKIDEINNKKVLCLYKKNSHDSVKIDSCKIMNEQFDYVIKCVNEYLDICNLKVYNEKTKKGELKHLVCRIINNDLLLTFVLHDNKNLNDIEILYKKLTAKFKNVGINKNINKSDKEILSYNFINLIGKNEIKFNSLNINQKITNGSFLQVNNFIASEIYSFVLKNISGNIVNCYSGAGLLSSILAKNNINNTIYAIEINKEAHKLAQILKQENNVLNLKNFCGDAGTVLDKLNLKDYNLVLDPPKSGIDDKMINVILKNSPKKIIYISCDKNSLAKNLKMLFNKYNLTNVTAFDMFPQTKNLETVVILEKK